MHRDKDTVQQFSEHDDVLVKGHQVRGERGASVALQAATSAALFHCGSTAQTESRLGVQGYGGRGKNTLIPFSEEPTALLERRMGTPGPSNHN